MDHPVAPRRPRSVEEMRTALSNLQSAESVERAREYRADPSDVFIATYPKCGTTWMQQIVHGLRSGGSMEFGEISEVVPWIECALDLGIDPTEKRWTPRAFKTHFNRVEVPGGARYIYIVRDPKDVLISFYRFFEGWMFEPGSIDLETFARSFFIEGSRSGRYWEHVRSWWPHREDPEVLFLSFESMKRDLERVVLRVAEFIATDPDHIAIATEQARFDFMRDHGQHFDEHFLRNARDTICGIPPGKTSKVRAGRVGDASQLLTPALHDELDAIWQREITEPLGFADYRELEAAIPAL